MREPQLAIIKKQSSSDKVGIVLADEASVAGNRVVVHEVKAGGLAASSGIPIGARVFSVNGTSVTDFQSAIDLIKAASGAVEIRFQSDQLLLPSAVAVDVSAAKEEPPPVPSDKQLVVLIPDNEDEVSTWCATLKSELEADGTVEARIVFPVLKVLRCLDEKMPASLVAKVLGATPERTVVVGRTEGADCVLYLLEQRKLGGGVLYDFKNREVFLWAEIRKNAGTMALSLKRANARASLLRLSDIVARRPILQWVSRSCSLLAGPRGGNLALVNAEPPQGSRFPERFATKLGIGAVLEAEKLTWATRSAIRGVAGTEPKRVRVLALTAGLSADVFRKWKLPKSVEIEVVSAAHHFANADNFEDGLVGIGRALAAELVYSRVPMLDRPSVILGHDLGAWLAYELLVSLEALRVRDGKSATWQMPSVLIVSSMRAPHLYDANQACCRVYNQQVSLPSLPCPPNIPLQAVLSSLGQGGTCLISSFIPSLTPPNAV